MPSSAPGLGYKEVTANTVSEDYVIEEDLKAFLSETSFNQGNYRKLLRKYGNDEKALFAELIPFLLDRVKSIKHMALFFNSNKNFTFQGLTFSLYAPSGSELKGDKDFKENIFSVVQELPYKYKHDGKILFSFRPDMTFFGMGFTWLFGTEKQLEQSGCPQGRTQESNQRLPLCGGSLPENCQW